MFFLEACFAGNPTHQIPGPKLLRIPEVCGCNFLACSKIHIFEEKKLACLAWSTSEGFITQVEWRIFLMGIAQATMWNILGRQHSAQPKNCYYKNEEKNTERETIPGERVWNGA